MIANDREVACRFEMGGPVERADCTALIVDNLHSSENQIVGCGRDSGVVETKVSPFLRPLHGDPRWGPFLRKIGLAD